MKRTVLIIVIFLLGVGLLAYPSVSNYIAEKNGSYAIDSYDEAIAVKDEEFLSAERQKAQEYNESLLGSPVRDPFIPGSGIVMQDDYYEILNIGGMMGYIEIPKISIKLPIYHGTSEEVLKKGVGHLEGSTLPIGGEGTHSVLTGHTGLSSAKLFTDLSVLQEGDLFYLYLLDEVLVYEVDEIKVIEPEQTTDLKPVSGEDYCTLLTCTPYGVNSHRLLLRGTRVDGVPEIKESIAEAQSSADRMLMLAVIITSGIMLILIIITIIVKRKQLYKKQ